MGICGQAISFEVQKTYFENLIKKNPEWELVEIYADEAKTGTNTKKRVEFNKMIEDCKNGKIDLIVTKSISRFARNTIDALTHIRMLKELSIGVFFEKENVNTLDSKGEF